MTNYDWDDMNNDGNAGKGILGLLAATLIGGAAISSVNKKKQEEIARKRAALQQELQNVRCELANKSNGFFKSAWYADEIKQLEIQEKQILHALNDLE